MNILIVEDDEKILKSLKKGLKEEGFVVDVSKNGKEGLYLAEHNSYDIMILDWCLPELEGIDVCKKLRHGGNNTPILMLTVKNDIDDKVQSLDCGADDYMTKPFSFRELVARVRSLTRRLQYNNSSLLSVDTLTLDLQKREVKRSGQLIELTNKEFSILLYLLNNRGNIVTHTQLQDKIWGMDDSIVSNVINVFVFHLRKKINLDGEKPLIQTIRGSGYKIG